MTAIHEASSGIIGVNRKGQASYMRREGERHKLVCVCTCVSLAGQSFFVARLSSN